MRSNHIHFLPGRMRLRVPNLRGNNILYHDIYTFLKTAKGIKIININYYTGSVLIYFDPLVIDHYTIIIEIDSLRHTPKITSMVSGELPSILPNWQTVYVALTGAALLGVLIKQRFFGRSFFIDSFALEDFAIFLSILSGYPVLEKEIHKIRGINSVSLSLISLLILVLKESIEGLTISLVVNISKLITEIQTNRSLYHITKLSRLSSKVNILLNGKEQSIPASEIRPGDIVIAHAGDTLLVDGKVLDGRAIIDESRLTGTTENFSAEVGIQVLAGSEIKEGAVQILTEYVGKETYLYQLLNSAHHRTKNEFQMIEQKRINRVAYLSLWASGINYLITKNAARSLSMLLAALPSAAGLSRRTPIGSAIGKAADQRIYIRHEDFLLAASRVDVVAFDKTRTLSTNEIIIEEILSLDTRYTKEDILRYASSVEEHMRHPVAAAIRIKEEEMQMGPHLLADNLHVIEGKGVKAHTKGVTVLIGNRSLMEENNVSLKKATYKLPRYNHLSLTPLFIALDGKLCGLMLTKEKLKPQAKETIKRLRALGINQYILLTRDSHEAAEIAGNQLGFTESYGGLNSQQKADFIERLQHNGHIVAMIGDGVDDALAMAQSDVGIALGGKGRNSGALSAGIVIASEDPLLAAEVIKLSQNTREIVHQNLNLSLGLNVAGLGLGAAGIISPLGAGILNNIAVFTVLTNSITAGRS